jgi:hypothetical protein
VIRAAIGGNPEKCGSVYVAPFESPSNDPETNVVKLPQAVDEIPADGVAKETSDLLVFRGVHEQVDYEVEFP